MKICSITFLLSILLLLPFTNSLRAQERPGRLGLGGQIGDPSGITLKTYRRSDFAYDFLAAWDFDNFFFFNVHGLYERSIDNSPLHYYFGPGAFLGLRERRDDTEFVLGASGTIGINFFIESFEVFLQITPRLDVLPDTEGHLGGGLGLRYYFAQPRQ